MILVTDGEPTKDNFDGTHTDNTAAGLRELHRPDRRLQRRRRDRDRHGLRARPRVRALSRRHRQVHAGQRLPPGPRRRPVIDVYTVGFTTTPRQRAAPKTADGQRASHFEQRRDSSTTAIVASLPDIVPKSQSFTAATVPASRTATAAALQKLFLPPTTPYWEGHLRSYKITAAGEILDANGDCAVDNPAPPCNSGAFTPGPQPPYWDAGGGDPRAGAATCTPRLRGAPWPDVVEFDTRRCRPRAGVTARTSASTCPLAARRPSRRAGRGARRRVVRTCAAASGNGRSAPPACATLTARRRLPLEPARGRRAAHFVPEPSYLAPSRPSADRDRVIYAGWNDGFLHGFDAGTWETTPTPRTTTRHRRGALRLHALAGAPEHPPPAEGRWRARLLLRGRLAGGGGRLARRERYAGDQGHRRQRVEDAPGRRPAPGRRAYYALDVTDPEATPRQRRRRTPTTSGSSRARTRPPRSRTTWARRGARRS